MGRGTVKSALVRGFFMLGGVCAWGATGCSDAASPAEGPAPASASSRPSRHVVMLVRHGESVNNIFSQSKDLFRYTKEAKEIFARGLAKPGADRIEEDGIFSLFGPPDANRDTFLSVTGEKQAKAVADALFPGGKDLLGLLDTYKTIHVSPMRRTLATGLLLFARAVTTHGGRPPFAAAPWVHEQFKSVSDLAYDRDILIDFVTKYVDDPTVPLADTQKAFDSLLSSLHILPLLWSTTAEPVGGGLSYYPMSNGVPASKESKAQLCERIEKIEDWITKLPETPSIIVTHSAVIRHLFDRFMGGRKADNLGIFVGTLVDPGGTALPYWTDIHTLRSEVPASIQARVPTFLKDSDNVENFSADDPAKYCPFHLGIISVGPVPVVKCPSREAWGFCKSRDLALSIDGEYLMWSADFKPSTEHSNAVTGDVKGMLDIRGVELYGSEKVALGGKPPSASSASWFRLNQDLSNLGTETRSIKIAREKSALLRFSFAKTTSLSERKALLTPLH